MEAKEKEETRASGPESVIWLERRSQEQRVLLETNASQSRKSPSSLILLPAKKRDSRLGFCACVQ